ncbi:hypothetical protein [Sphingomonas sp. 10B4]|nr:hypothetical protein [Sphingomonas sp. 10B4]MDY7523676.1 hypothetical protein [Sphingomonas sp. 10B4]MEB0284569.1 hypothetical protein [Sphingomonas sp. 10B4]
MPTLVLADGEVLRQSGTILDYFDQIAGAREALVLMCARSTDHFSI